MARKTPFAGFEPGRARNRAAPHRVAVVAFDGVVLGDLSTACELFALARDELGRPCYHVQVCSPTPRVESMHVALVSPYRLAALKGADTVIVPGLDDLDRPLPEAVVRATRRAALRGARIASICTGAFVLAAAGLLDGKRATTHWLAAPELARRHPSITVDPNVLYIDSGELLTSAGAAAGFDLCLYMIRKDLGARVATDVARAIVMPLERSGGQAQFIVPESTISDGGAIPSLLEWLQQNLDRHLTLSALARRVAMSTRTLSRHFRDRTGTTPAQWVSHARVRRAQQLLETTALSIEEVAASVGFGSASVLRERFGQIVGTSPQAYRKAFRPGGRRTANDC